MPLSEFQRSPSISWPIRLENRKTAEKQPTRLSKHVWSLKNSDPPIQHEVKWKLRARTGIYFPGAKYCDTCITEAMLILEADRKTSLNLRTEILSKCPHMRKFSLHEKILLPRKRKKKWWMAKWNSLLFFCLTKMRSSFRELYFDY